jgi:Protein of unknown function (DUF4065)
MAGFDRERFRALVLYIAVRRRDDPRFGRTKLAKTLFYSDFEHYKAFEAPITGATYIRLPNGPFPKQLGDSERELADEGFVFPDYLKEEYEEKRLVPLKTFPLEWTKLFNEVQIGIVDIWAERVGSASARQISELSHDHPGWLLAERDGAEIPYRTATLPLDRPSPDQVEEAKGVARGRGWLSADGKWQWERESA